MGYMAQQVFCNVLINVDKKYFTIVHGEYWTYSAKVKLSIICFYRAKFCTLNYIVRKQVLTLIIPDCAYETILQSDQRTIPKRYYINNNGDSECNNNSLLSRWNSFHALIIARLAYELYDNVYFREIAVVSHRRMLRSR